MRSVTLAVEQYVLMGGKAQVLAGVAVFLELVRRGVAKSDGETVHIVATVEEVQAMLAAVEDRVASLTPPPPPCAATPALAPVALRSAA